MAPRAGDIRSPCPGWNTLANHGYINRNGRNISYDSFIAACSDAFGLPKVITVIGAVNAGIAAKIFPNGVLNSLSDLSNTHNVVEHDASLTRDDLYLGNNVALNPSLLNAMIPNVNGIIRKENIAAFRTQRIKDSQARNPTFTWKVTAQQPVSAAESAFLHTIFGQGNGTIPAKWLYQFLKNEQIPQGWTKRQISTLEFTGISAYYLAREIVSFGDSQLTDKQADEFAENRMKRFIQENSEEEGLYVAQDVTNTNSMTVAITFGNN